MNTLPHALSPDATPDVEATLTPPGFTHGFADVNGVVIHYVTGGTGSPVLLLHGWPETWLTWRDVMPLLAGQHTVIAADLRGFGRSDITAPGYVRQDMANDMLGLLAALGYPTATVVGHDWGADVAAFMAMLSQGAVSKLIVIEGTPIGSWLQAVALPYLSNPLWFYGFFRPPAYAEVVLDGHVYYFLSQGFYRNPAMHVTPLPDDVVNRYLDVYTREGRFAASLQPWRAIDPETAFVDQQASTPLSLPVLAVGAQFGSDGLIAASMQHIASDVTGQVIAGAGHFVTEEKPADVASLILNF